MRLLAPDGITNNYKYGSGCRYREADIYALNVDATIPDNLYAIRDLDQLAIREVLY
jgi:hypothetical protein